MLQSSQDTGEVGAGRIASPRDRIYAALDLGTNNCRLLIASAQPEGGLAAPAIKVFDSFSRIVRLGEGVSATGELSGDAMERTLAALLACKKKLGRYHITAARFVATEACRRARNGHEFLERVRKQTGLSIDIITSEEEAKLAFLGCSSLLTGASKRAIVFDIGGGSTELMWVDIGSGGSEHVIADWLSIGFGVMNLADKFGGAGLADLAFGDMVNFLVQRIRPFDEANRISEIIGDAPVQLLSTSGTVTTLAAVHLGLPRYDRSRIDGIAMPVADIRDTVQKLLTMRPSERFNHPCIGPDRADFILSGCAIFEAISSLWPQGAITIADRGVREGIILSLMNRR
ncbi:MAG: Ppx/GppA family phosphatase [Pseudomonadota bacterium]|nr:Ppx/GppA family phosphatase [Pseudomonadota bacterium]MDE3038599.1 Ppx/GppA family phosphatase [Pseudomonadota bacterium]